MPYSGRRQSMRFTELEPVVGILITFLVATVLLVSVVMVEEPANSRGEVHSDIQSMRQGGDAASRNTDVFSQIWILGLSMIVMYALLMSLGVSPQRRDRCLALYLGCAALFVGATWSALMVTYRDSWTGAMPPIFLGFPIPSAWMLYGMWASPLLFIGIYWFGFRRWIFTVEDENRYEALCARLRSTGRHWD